MMRLIAITPAAAIAVAMIVMAVSSAHAGPCTTDIARVEQQIAANATSVVAGPSAPQSVAAQLGRQPTPETVQSATHQANALGQAALNRARDADDAGNPAACRQALAALKNVYGIP
jgi:hypothetical protein